MISQRNSELLGHFPIVAGRIKPQFCTRAKAFSFSSLMSGGGGSHNDTKKE